MEKRIPKILPQLFPMIRTREDIQREIDKKPALKSEFSNWSRAHQEEFLEFCSGARGIKILYDVFFKEIFSPEINPSNLESLLQTILGKNLHILQILPNDNIRILEETTLMVTDIIVELDDHSIVNVEVQKVGYLFPGERCSCYLSDMLLRQYKRVVDRKKEKFSYRDLEPVYLIVFFEKSPKELSKSISEYIHHGYYQYDTDLPMRNLLESYLISLDIFKKNMQNKAIETEREAWLTFLSCDEPEMIHRLVTSFPEFRELYGALYRRCYNLENMVWEFSEELRIMDRNTAKLMIDEMQEELDTKKEEVAQTKVILSQVKDELEHTQGELEHTQGELEQTLGELEHTQGELIQTKDKLFHVLDENEKMKLYIKELEQKVK